MDIRENKVSEVNRILPMIRETINKQKNIKGLEEKLEQQENFCNQLNKELKGLRSTINVVELDETAKKRLEKIKEDKEKTKEKVVILIEDYEHQIRELKAQIDFEDALYSAIGNAITIGVPSDSPLCGAYDITELQEEWIEEYVYLISMHTNQLDMNKFLFVDMKKFNLLAVDEFYKGYVDASCVSMDRVLKAAIKLAKKLK